MAKRLKFEGYAAFGVASSIFYAFRPGQVCDGSMRVMGKIFAGLDEAYRAGYAKAKEDARVKKYEYYPQ